MSRLNLKRLVQLEVGMILIEVNIYHYMTGGESIYICQATDTFGRRFQGFILQLVSLDSTEWCVCLGAGEITPHFIYLFI